MDGPDNIHIGEFAKLAGCNLRTLRYYEELGLITPVARTEGGFRLYHENQLPRVTAIRRLQGLGLSLKEIAAALSTEAPGDGERGQIDRVLLSLDRQITMVREKIDKLSTDLRDLNDARSRLQARCSTCDLPFGREHCDPCEKTGEPLEAVLRALL